MAPVARVTSIIVLGFAIPCSALRAEIVATYLGNEGVLVAYGETRILFDPLNKNSYNQYQIVPADIKEAIFAGSPPFDGVDAVFVSHNHEDHFSAEEMLQLLQQQTALRLYAPAQVVAGLFEFADSGDPIFERVVGIDLEYGDAPAAFEFGALKLSAVWIGHSGWPEAMTNIQNYAFRVTLDGEATVLHIGDADTSDEHYARDAEHWDAEKIDMAFPPYWYFSSAKGRGVLTNRLKPRHSVGVHVPVKMPDNPAQRPAEYRGYDLFTEPGQTRRIEVNQ